MIAFHLADRGALVGDGDAVLGGDFAELVLDVGGELLRGRVVKGEGGGGEDQEGKNEG